MRQPEHVLPDVLEPGLKVVFCGTAAGTVSARRGAYYAHPQNKFWRVLFAVGLTPRLVRPEEYRELPQWGLGLTDIAKHVSGMDRELPAALLGTRRLRGADRQDFGRTTPSARVHQPHRRPPLARPDGGLRRQRRADRENTGLHPAVALADGRLEF